MKRASLLLVFALQCAGQFPVPGPIVGSTAATSGGGSVFTGSTAVTSLCGASVTISLADIAVKSPLGFEPCVLTQNTAFTLTNKTAGAFTTLKLTQDGTGGWLPTITGATICPIVPTANITTWVPLSIEADGSTVVVGTCRSSETGVYRAPETTAPATVTGNGACWFDSTNHVWSCRTNAGVVTSMGGTTSAASLVTALAAINPTLTTNNKSALYLMQDLAGGASSSVPDVTGNNSHANDGTMNGTFFPAVSLNSAQFGVQSANGIGIIGLPVSVCTNATAIGVWFRPQYNFSPTLGTTPSTNQTLLATDSGTYIGGSYGAAGLWGPFNQVPNNSGSNLPVDKIVGDTSLFIVLGATPTVYINGNPVSGYIQPQNSFTALAGTSCNIGWNAQNGNFAFQGSIYAVEMLAGSLPAGTSWVSQNVGAVNTYLANRGTVIKDGIDYSKNATILIGDSIAGNVGQIGAANTSPIGYLANLIPSASYENIALPAETCVTEATSTRTGPLQVRMQKYAGPVTVISQCGANDLITGTSAANIVVAKQGIDTAVHLGGGYDVMGTIMARSNASGAQETVRTTANASLITNFLAGPVATGGYRTNGDGLYDPGGDPLVGNILFTTDLSLFTDGTHPTALVNSYVADKMAAGSLYATGFRTPYTVKVTLPRGSLLGTSATTGSVKLFQLSPYQAVCGVVMQHRTSFKGTSVTAYTVSVGDTSGSQTQYAPVFDVFQAPSSTTLQNLSTCGSPTFSATTGGVVTAYATSTGGNVNAVYTNLVVDASNPAKVTSGSYNFTAADVGSELYISTGTGGWTAGLYTVISTASNAAVLDRSPAATLTTGGSFLLGELDVWLTLVNRGGGGGSSFAVGTASNCSSSASPAVCGSAAAGSVAFPTGVTSVALTVNTTAVTANSQIFFSSDDTLGTKLGVTCNSTLATLVGGIAVTARTAGTSFQLTYSGTIATNPLCVNYQVLN